MGGEVQQVSLGDTVDLLTGYPFKSDEFSNIPQGLRLLRGDNVVQGKTRWDGAKYWSRDVTAALETYRLRAGDVVLAMDRPWIAAGLKHATLTEADCPSLLVQRVARLRARAGMDQRFLGYVIRSIDFTNYILGVQTGTAVPHISGGQIKAFRFVLPPLRTQEQVAELLGALDDKIELNRRLAGTLEAMARALFRSWFVDFDPVHAKAKGHHTGLPDDLAELFPNDFGDDGLPEGWTSEPIGDMFDVRGGNTPSTGVPEYWDGLHHWATPKDLSGLTSPVLVETERRLTNDGLAQVTSGLLPPSSLLLSTRAPIGYLAFNVHPTAINQGFAGFVRRKASPAFAWLWCLTNMDVLKGNAGGSTFPEISKSVLRGLPVLAPPAPLQRAFDTLIDSIVARIITASAENQTLAALRDTLLPKLISGELRIDDAAAEVSAA